MTKEEKIKVVEYAKKLMISAEKHESQYLGICNVLYASINEVRDLKCWLSDMAIEYNIPEFKEIRKKYNPRNYYYWLWFPLNKENYQKRLDILNELIELIKKGE